MGNILLYHIDVDLVFIFQIRDKHKSKKKGKKMFLNEFLIINFKVIRCVESVCLCVLKNLCQGLTEVTFCLFNFYGNSNPCFPHPLNRNQP